MKDSPTTKRPFIIKFPVTQQIKNVLFNTNLTKKIYTHVRFFLKNLFVKS